jgi:hypothetical protein
MTATLRRHRWCTALVAGALAAAALPATAAAHPNSSPAPAVAAPPGLSTTGDYATDTFADPWDFSNDEDVPPVHALIGSENGSSITRTADGWLKVIGPYNTTIKLVRTWDVELPWGRDGLLHPVNADVYTVLSFSMCLTGARNMGVHYFNAAGQDNIVPFYPTAGCGVYHVDLKNTPGIMGATPTWSGSVIRVELLVGQDPAVEVNLDWVRLHRADAPSTPPVGLPMPQVLTPNEQGGTDLATAAGNPWDFAELSDIYEIGDLANLGFGPGGMTGQTVANDPYVEVRLPAPINPDRYHRATVEVCYDGPMDFADAPGGGMNGRFAWFAEGGPGWSETQDIIIYPGCNTMTVDLATNPAVAVNDENTVFKRGWRGQRITRFRYDLNEDRGVRGFTLRSLKLADDAAFVDSYAITYQDTAATAGTVADIYVTTNRGAFDGTPVAIGRPVTAGVNSFTWNGTTSAGAAMPNGTYWVYVVMRNGAGTGVHHSTGPVRIERPVALTPSYYVPLSPKRLLDTRDGTGGNLVPLGPNTSTELIVAGNGGVPATHVTAVVLNVTAVNPTAGSFLTVFPSRESLPPVSNLNFVAGQVVPNLVTVKLGSNGRVDIYNLAGNTDVVADVMGYYTDVAPASGRFTPVTPSRILDTRNPADPLAGPVPGGGVIDLTVVGVGGVPASGVSAVAVNVTVDQPSTDGFVTVWPTGEPMPTASTHNFVPGLTVANLVLAKVGNGGKVSLFNSKGSTHLVADVVGYYSASGGRFIPVSPQRMVDTRYSIGPRLGSLDAGGAFAAPISSGAGAVVNVTSVDSTATSYLTAWPAGENMPVVSTLNPRPGVPVPNQAYLKLGLGGQLAMFNFAGTSHVIVDLFGYFE